MLHGSGPVLCIPKQLSEAMPPSLACSLHILCISNVGERRGEYGVVTRLRQESELQPWMLMLVL